MGSANFYTEVIAYNTIEETFASTVVNYITGLDSRITCDNDPAYEYNRTERGDSYVPKFDFYFNNNLIFTMTRGDTLSRGANGYVLYAKRGNQTIDSIFVGFANTSVQGINVIINRYFNVSHIINDDFIFIDVHTGFNSSGTRNGMKIIYVKCESDEYMGYGKMTNNSEYNPAGVFNISGSSLIGLSSQTSGTFISRFQYKSMPGKIDYVTNCVYATAGQKQFDIRALYDCTEVTAGDTLSLDDGRYIAIGPHQLVKISDT